jgi:integrase
MRGDGRIFKQRGSPFFWCAYYDAKGKERYEVCFDRKNSKIPATVDAEGKPDEGAENTKQARKYLRKLVDAVRAESHGAPAFIVPETRRLTVNAILDQLEIEYKKGDRRKRIPREISPQMKSHLKRVRDYFGEMRAVNVDGEKVQEFVSSTIARGKQNATVNRSLQLLGQAYKISRVPCGFQLSLLDESQNVRKGKFTPEEAVRVAISLPAYLSDVARFAYESGARVGEILKMRWGYVQGEVIAVPAADTKSRTARSIEITPALEEIIERRRKARAVKCDLIFHNSGSPIVDYRKAWHSGCVLNGLGLFYCRSCRNDQGKLDSVLDAKRTCERCGKRWDVPKYVGRIMHDFRRSASYEMWRSGSTIEECMEVTGHKTPAMFKRYADLFTEDERRATRRKVQEQRIRWRDEQITSRIPLSAQPN